MTYRGMPGCKGCGSKTRTGGVSRDMPAPPAAGEQYEVRDETGKVLWSGGSIVAAATFMRGHPRSKVHTRNDANVG